MGKKFVDPEEIPVKIIDRFFREIEESDKKDFFARGSDHFGVEKLRYLILVLETIEAEQKYWNRVLDFALKRASAHSVGFYTLTLLCLSPHVSITKREEIVRHFSERGDYQNVFHLVTAQLFRKPNREEIAAIAQYHKRHYTSSENEMWEELLRLAREGDHDREVELILGFLAELKKYEHEPDLY